MGRNGLVDVDAFVSQPLPHDRFRPVVGDVETLLAAVEADPDKGNRHGQLLFRAVVD